MERLEEFVAGRRAYEDIEFDEFVLPVELWPDGSISTEDDEVFPKPNTD